VINSRTQSRPNTLPEKKGRMKVGSAAGQLGRQWKPLPGRDKQPNPNWPGHLSEDVINSRTQTRPNIKVPISCVHYGHNVRTYEIALKSALQTVPDSRWRFCHLEYHVLGEVSTAYPAAQPPTPLSSFPFFLGVCCVWSGLTSGCLSRPERGFYCLPTCHLLTINQNS